MGLFAGALADRVHRPRLVAAALTLWSVLTAASGAARGFASLLAPRMFIGVGESVLTPASMSMLSDRFPPSRMGFASGFYYMGVPIGVGLSLLIKGYVGPVIGWRNCFYLLGGIGVLFAIGMLFVKEKRRNHPALESPPKLSAGETVRTVARALSSSPALMFTIGGGVAFHFILGASAFDQLWFVQERGFDKDRIAQLTGWVGLVGGISGNLFGGFAGDWWQRNTSSGRPMFLFWVSLAFTPIGFLYRVVDPTSVWFFVCVGAGLLPARNLLRSHLRHRPGARAGRDPRDGRRLLLAGAEPGRPWRRHHGGRHSDRLLGRGRPCGTLYDDPARLHRLLIAGHSLLLDRRRGASSRIAIGSSPTPVRRRTSARHPTNGWVSRETLRQARSSSEVSDSTQLRVGEPGPFSKSGTPSGT